MIGDKNKKIVIEYLIKNLSFYYSINIKKIKPIKFIDTGVRFNLICITNKNMKLKNYDIHLGDTDSFLKLDEIIAMKRILVIAPHADDEVLGLGGTISKYIDKSYQVIVLVMTNANKGNPKDYSENLINKIRKESRSCEQDNWSERINIL